MYDKILLVAINSKYIHSNLAVLSLKTAATPYDDNVSIAEYTINNRMEDVLRGIYEQHPDVIGFSCYIWNISMVKELISELNKLLPKVPVWLGGPEVTYCAPEYVYTYSNVAGVMKGEGELIFKEITACYMENRIEDLKLIPGVVMCQNGELTDNPCPPPVNMNEINVKYDTDILEHKIIYYESSRGCPFSCSYCLSSVDKMLRFRDSHRVREDLKMFIEHGVKQVKFVDRTFNCRKSHAMDIWRFIKENDRGITNFHFEIAADLLDDEEIELLNSMRPGLVQLEIGVQSTNCYTIEAIHRKMDLKKLEYNIRKIRQSGNIHIHLDLIAGLPYEDFTSFAKSFNDIYNMKPDQLQLGFLKLLHGSLMREEKDKYGIVCIDKPPYEVLFTNWLSYEDVLKLKLTENVVEMFYNSAMAVTGLKYMESFFTDAFSMYMRMGVLYDEIYPSGSLPSRNAKYELLYEFAKPYLNEQELLVLTQLLKYDMLTGDNLKSLPGFIKPDYEAAAMARALIPGRKLTKAEHVEIFDIDVMEFADSGRITYGKFPLYFNYLQRDPLTNKAFIKEL